jgi:N-acyl homoserine lactone hydrolase
MTKPARIYLIHQYSRDIAVPSGSILMSTGCYLVQTDDGRNILIDSGMPVDADGSDPPTEESAGILAQLRELRVRPEDVEVVICTHFDIDHVGHHEHFINAEHIVQREQYEVAVSGAERFASGRSHWDAPGTQRRLVDGDVELMPGLRLVETSGHAPGHQSVLVTLPGTGPVLVAGDAVSLERQFSVDRQPRSYEDGFERARASCSTSYPARRSHSRCSTTTASNGESCGVRLKRMSDRPRLPERHDPEAGMRPEPEHAELAPA